MEPPVELLPDDIEGAIDAEEQAEEEAPGVLTGGGTDRSVLTGPEGWT